jgi:Alpha amylase, catalytic domain
MHPLLYEINTRCWLRLLSDREGRGVTLAEVPDSEFQRWRRLGFTHIWLMGVWTTGPRCREHALHSEGLKQTLDRILPGWTADDVPGSPYAIGAYEVPSRLGGEDGLKAFREKLNSMGMKLLLDFVPNHVGLDFPWVTHEPELLIYSREKKPGTFLQPTDAGPRWLAHGRDPHFPPWVDTVQINYSRPEARAKMLALLQSVASRCDGVRCDMAMLLLNEVFAKTWADFVDADAMPRTEFWADAIPAVKKAHPDFLFFAEAYWNLEARLQSLGFDYTYDKTIYDHILDYHHAALQSRVLDSPPGFVAKCAHFLENHDEKRIATILTPAEHRAAALLILGLPGMRFLYEGELEGWRVQVPVHVARWPKEPTDAQIHGMYEKLLGALKESAVGRGEYRLLRPVEAEGHRSAKHFVVVQWQKAGNELDLVAVNLDLHGGLCRVHLAAEGLAKHDWIINDALGGGESQRYHGGDLEAQGFLLDLPGHGAQLLHFQAA